MEDEFGRPIGMEDSAPSSREHEYLFAMAKEASRYHDTVIALAITLKLDTTEIIPDVTINKFREVLNAHRSVAERLAAWSRNNLDMDRFPADYYELENAKGLAVQGKQKSAKLRNQYRMVLDTMTNFDHCPDQQDTITAIGRSVDKLHVLILDAQASVAEDKYTVDPKYLNNLDLIRS